MTRKYIAPFLFLYKNRAIAHGVQYQPKEQHQNLSLHFDVWKTPRQKWPVVADFRAKGRFCCRRPVMVNCEFSDQTPHGWTNWIQQPSPFFKSNAYASLAPHSGIVVRVPLPPSGQNRKVAVLYRPDPAPWQLWLCSPRGESVAIILLRVLPRSTWPRLFRQQPLLRAWCDRALTNQWDGVGQQ